MESKQDKQSKKSVFANILLFLILSSFVSEHSVFAQELTILSVQGSVSLRRGGEIKQASTGDKLREKDAVITKSPCYAVLSSASGKTLEIRTAGTMTGAEINAKLKTVSGGIGGKLANYIFSELKNSAQANQDNKQNMASTAMTERTTQQQKKDAGNEIFGIASGETNQTGESTSKKTAGEGALGATVSTALNSIGLGGLLGGETTQALADSAGTSARAPRVQMFPHDTYLLDSTVHLFWSCEKPDQTFILRVFSPFKLVFETTTKDSAYRLDTRPFAVDTGQCYRWNVGVQGFSPDVKPQEYCLTETYQFRTAAVRDSVASLRRELGQTSALANAAAGVVYARNRFFLPAFQAYTEAIRLAPNVEEYRLAYRQFLREWQIDEQFIEYRLRKKKQ